MNFKILMELRRYLNVAHHVPGRIRLKFSLDVLKDPEALKLMKEFEDSPRPKAVRQARVNKMARSVVIEYDRNVIDPEMLDEVLKTKNAARFETLAAELENKLS
ncbi:HMA2 domain-containing protein [Maridesulfovibrio bastinii]|uniref:HMA2 domain-containing protein n=1 Tax=Maridesulfovibrio bastinii TaxID=47157 RepID=UPI00040AF647|nr:hypothetical protein [Maridesulfovibrio bastinii]